MKLLFAILVVVGQSVASGWVISSAVNSTTKNNGSEVTAKGGSFVLPTTSYEGMKSNATSSPDPQCFDEEGNPISRTPFANEEDCESFFMCVHGKLFTRQCPDGLAFDPIQNVCNYPIQVPGCEYLDGVDPSLSGYCVNNDNTPIEPPPPPILKPGTCDTYYYCYNNGTMGEQTCPPELVFNPDKLECDYENHLPECVTGETLSTVALANVTTSTNVKQWTERATTHFAARPGSSTLSPPASVLPITDKEAPSSTIADGASFQTTSPWQSTTQENVGTVPITEGIGSTQIITTKTTSHKPTTADVAIPQSTTEKIAGPDITPTDIKGTWDPTTIVGIQSTGGLGPQPPTTKKAVSLSSTSGDLHQKVTTAGNKVSQVTTENAGDPEAATTRHVQPQSSTVLNAGSPDTPTSSKRPIFTESASASAGPGSPLVTIENTAVQSTAESNEVPQSTTTKKVVVSITPTNGESPQYIATEYMESLTTSFARVGLRLFGFFPFIVSLSCGINTYS